MLSWSIKQIFLVTSSFISASIAGIQHVHANNFLYLFPLVLLRVRSLSNFVCHRPSYLCACRTPYVFVPTPSPISTIRNKAYVSVGYKHDFFYSLSALLLKSAFMLFPIFI